MSQRIIEEIIDDVDGTLGATPFYFSVAGVSYEIDLNEANAAKFQQQMDFWIDRARIDRTGFAGRAPHRTVNRRASVPTVAGFSRLTNDQRQAIRQWWRDNASLVRLRTGREFNERGPLPGNVRDLYAETVGDTT